jgi:hypothetical protein
MRAPDANAVSGFICELAGYVVTLTLAAMAVLGVFSAFGVVGIVLK